MDNVQNDGIKATADTAGAEEREIAAAELGKFKSVDALLSAYKSLEAEFTRRTQRLRELENENKAQNNDVKIAPSPESGNVGLPQASVDEDVKRAVIEEYLKAVSSKSVPLISGGVAPAAPRSALKSVKEAGALVQRFLKNE